MDRIELKAAKRDITGKKVKVLRRNGIIPVNLFGPGIESVSLQCEAAELQNVMRRAGQTKIIDLKIDSEKKARAIMIRKAQILPLKNDILHVDLYQVKMTDELKVEVPVVLTGEALVTRAKENILVQELNSINVQCLPANMPSEIEVDISVLTEPDQVLRVKDITVKDVVTIVNDPEVVVVRISVQPTEKREAFGEDAANADAVTSEQEKTETE